MALGTASARLISAATTNATLVRAGRGTVYGWVAWNVNAAARYLKLYDSATAPTVGTTVPLATIMLGPGVTTVDDVSCGIAFARGISYAITTGAADADTAAVAASEIGLTLLYS